MSEQFTQGPAPAEDDAEERKIIEGCFPEVLPDTGLYGQNVPSSLLGRIVQRMTQGRPPAPALALVEEVTVRGVSVTNIGNLSIPKFDRSQQAEE